MMDHTHLQLASHKEPGTRQTPTANQTLPPSPPAIFFYFQKEHLLQPFFFYFQKEHRRPMNSLLGNNNK